MDNSIYYIFISLAFLFYLIYNVRSNLYILEYDKPNSTFIEISGKVVYLIKKKVVRKSNSTVFYCPLFECEVNGEIVNIEGATADGKYEIGSEHLLLYHRASNQIWVKADMPLIKKNVIRQLVLATALFILIITIIVGLIKAFQSFGIDDIISNPIFYIIILLATIGHIVRVVTAYNRFLMYDKPSTNLVEITGKMISFIERKTMQNGRQAVYNFPVFECEIDGETVNIEGASTNRNYEIGIEVPLLYRKKTNEVWIKTEMPVLKENAIKQIRKTILLDLAGLLFFFILVSL